jgi:hypothetical protein
MFGKHFESLYEGSMVGAGAMVFAVWGYVIAKWKPDKDVGGQVRLNPALLASILGESTEDIHEAIDYLCKPDPNSTSKVEEGRRLIRLGQFDYQVVNAARYHALKNEEHRREQNRAAQATFRAKLDRKKNAGRPLPGERTYVNRQEAGAGEAELDRLSEPSKVSRGTKA